MQNDIGTWQWLMLGLFVVIALGTLALAAIVGGAL